jgi:hypothetical protein
MTVTSGSHVPVALGVYFRTMPGATGFSVDT